MAEEIQTANRPRTRVPTQKKFPGRRSIIGLSGFPKAYAVISVFILLATTLFWSLLGANLHRGNADQAVNAYLFEHASTLHGALIPGQHSFLIKWPLFFLIKLFGYSPAAFTSFTVGIVLVTIAVLAMIMYRIERRPLVFGTLCLALASTLFLVPAVPYAGGILPVNMAMITTRNLEYLLYIASVLLIVQAPGLRSRKLWAAVGLMSLLIASDKLFLTLSLGGALLALVVYVLARGRNLVSLSVRWLISGALAAFGAITILWLLNASHITHISSQSVTGPYGLARGGHDLALGVIYGLLGIVTNFGANPAYDATITQNITHQVFIRIASFSGITYVINAVVLAFGIFCMWRLMGSSLARNKNERVALDTSSRLSIILIWTTITAFGVFALSNHYYPVDARYLTISLFAAFISAATFVRRWQWQPKKIVLVGLVLVIGILVGIPTVIRTYHANKTALSSVNERNALIAQALDQHPVKVLVGDYWRVIPTKLVARQQLDVMPLSGCTQARDLLSSQAWQPDLKKLSFAYLLSVDPSLTDYPNCTLDQVIAAYGRPNTSVLIAGTLNQPKEQLIFYDAGINLKKPSAVVKKPSTVVPILLGELPGTSCAGPSIMNIVAHEDDDLLFMNPDLQNDINAGHCVRTIYVTAGDAGAEQLYWLKRKHGSEAAYDYMDGPQQDIWVERIVRLASGQFITVASPRGNSRVSLIFMYLPDGNINGKGFAASRHESLQRLEEGKLGAIHSVDKQSSYTSDQFAAALTSLIYAYQPTEIRTLANYASRKFPDHSDHTAVSRYVKKVHKQYTERVIIPLTFYIGYPIREKPQNVSGNSLKDKQNAFFEYAKYDGSVCGSIATCSPSSAYNFYLPRQYQSPH